MEFCRSSASWACYSSATDKRRGCVRYETCSPSIMFPATCGGEKKVRAKPKDTEDSGENKRRQKTARKRKKKSNIIQLCLRSSFLHIRFEMCTGRPPSTCYTKWPSCPLPTPGAELALAHALLRTNFPFVPAGASMSTETTESFTVQDTLSAPYGVGTDR